MSPQVTTMAAAASTVVGQRQRAAGKISLSGHQSSAPAHPSGDAHSSEAEKPAADEMEELAADEDYKDYKAKGLVSDVTSLFEADFIAFSRWLRKDINARYTTDDFIRINRKEVLQHYTAVTLLVVLYLALHFWLGPYRAYWRVPLFILSFWVFRTDQVLHTRMHWPKRMTGWPALDTFVDWTLILVTGVSKEAFHRRHVDEHMTDVANMARLFGDEWLPFLDLPWVWFLRPLAFFELFSERKVKQFRLDRRQLAVEAVGLCLYLGLAAYELWCGSNFIVCYHMLPMTWSISARLFTGMFTHSAVDRRNSFNSCGIFHERDAKGLFKLTVWMINLLTNRGLSQHGLHHGYTQCPPAIINANIEDINAHILANYKHVRYNRIFAHEVHRDSLARLPPPRYYDYAVQALVNLACITATMFTVFGFDVSPYKSELAMVDYRALIRIPKAERYANFIAMLDSLAIRDRARKLRSQHHYLLSVRAAGNAMQAYLKAHQPGTRIPPHRLYAPDDVYRANGIPTTPAADYGTMATMY